ncbi:MAG: DEAD/DEAH box helicase [Agathobacter sp.]|nr:DEAD/DEAH box helicase [Agathobacter sp.]
MTGRWTISNNHIAFIYENQLFHPNGEEVYRVLDNEADSFIADIPCRKLRDEFSNVHFSKIGSPIKCQLDSENDEIMLLLYVMRKGKKIVIDMIEGEIIDQCIHGDEWFYVSGSIQELAEIFRKAGVKSCGRLTCAQYIEIIKNQDSFEKGTVINNVKISLLNKPVDIYAELPRKLNAKLYTYQKTGYFWMRYMLEENGGCILGDEMGLGKTLQVITLMLDYKNKGNTPMLVVAPVSLLQNWKRECEKFAPDLRCCVHHGAHRTGRFNEFDNYDVVIISYSIAVNDASILNMVEWKLVVLDEAQNIKNPDSERTKFVKKIPRRRSIAVTGTPFENHVSDIWSLVDFVIPGLFGTQEEYARTITDDLDGADKIEPMLSPIMIRRMVKDVATDLPDKIVIPQPLVMSSAEGMRYETFRENARASSQKGNINLGVLQKLRMFCTHPAICEEDCRDYYTASVKYQRFCEILEEVCSLGEKVIVFTSYQKMFEIIGKDVSTRYDIPVWKINGSTPVGERQSIVDSFNEFQGSALLVLNPRAAGTGLNITSANHVIHYNLEWNPALEDQASARAYRRGQQKTVFVYRLYYEDTVEQIVNERIERKREMASAAVVGTDGMVENRADIIAALNISPIKEENDG